MAISWNGTHLFKSLILHNNEFLEPVKKFQFLLSWLTGEALNLIKSLS